jgi:uncharacterized protein YndB with AHSA1/START domain
VERLTDSDTLAKWIMENNFQPIVGHKCHFRNEQWNLIVNCEVLVVDEPCKLSYTWVGGPINTTVRRILKQYYGITYLHHEQTGPEKEDQAFNGAKYGWANMIEELNKVLEDM